MFSGTDLVILGSINLFYCSFFLAFDKKQTNIFLARAIVKSIDSSYLIYVYLSIWNNYNAKKIRSGHDTFQWIQPYYNSLIYLCLSLLEVFHLPELVKRVVTLQEENLPETKRYELIKN